MASFYVSGFDYERWANQRVLGAMSEADGASMQILAHIFGAHNRWLDRVYAFLGEPKPFEPADNYHDELELICAAWPELVNSCGVDMPIPFERGDERYEIRLGDIVRQILNHSVYHRGQLSIKARQAGQEFPETDLDDYYFDTEATPGTRTRPELERDLDYELWATQRWAPYLDSIPGASEIEAHHIEAHRHWLERVGSSAKPSDIEEIVEAWKEAIPRDPDELGPAGPFSAVVTHVVQHGTYHRGQMRELAGERNFPDTDFAIFVFAHPR